MPSQEDYLDSLLKDMAKDGETGETEFSGDLEDLDLESLDLGEADLGEGLMEAEESELPEDLGDLDLESLDLGEADLGEDLTGTGESELPEDLSESSGKLADIQADSAVDGDWDETDVSDILGELDGEEEIGDMSGSLNLDSVSEMTEEEIEKLLVSNDESVSEDFLQSSDEDLSDEDVLKMLEESDDSELQEIQELLTKSDRNEAVDDLFVEASQDVPGEETEVVGLAENDRKDTAENKKMSAREKKELARAKRQEKKEQAAARKAEKKAAKEAAKAARKKGAKPEQSPENQVRAEEPELSEDFEAEPDMAVLDSIISEAGGEKMSQAGEEDLLFDGGEKDPVLAELEDIIDNAVGPEPEAEESAEEAPEGEDDLGLGLDGLFGDGDVDAALLEGEGASDFPDFLEVDSAEADAFIPERNKSAGQEEKGKKPLLSKLMDFLSEEDPEEENEDIRLSQENEGILKDLDKEKGGKGSGGKKGKAKKY